MKKNTDFWEEPSKKVPVAFDVDVAVVGGGVAGVFAAISAARMGAETVLIERFSYPGGNMGPGMIAGGNLTGWPIKHIKKGPFGLPAEFMERHAGMGGGNIPPFATGQYIRDSNIASSTALSMLEESGVHQLYTTFASDPILGGDKGKTVLGVCVENKSGRQAVKAKVVIDASGEADLARRCGAPVIYPKAEYYDSDKHGPTGAGTYYAVGNTDWDRFLAFAGGVEVSKDDWDWAEREFGSDVLEKWKEKKHSIRGWDGSFIPLLPILRSATDTGGFSVVQKVRLDDSTELPVFTRFFQKIDEKRGIVGARVELKRLERLDWTDQLMISRIESRVRIYLSEYMEFLKKNVPGFEKAILLTVAPYFGARGGPCIEGDYTLTTEDMTAGKRFPDVVYIYDHIDWLFWNEGRFGKKASWTDVPYRVMLPKGLNGLLAVGRSASSIPDTLLRSRMAVMHMGEAGGAAAALAVSAGVAPRDIDIRELQKRLLTQGYYLGDSTRLQELKLI